MLRVMVTYNPSASRTTCVLRRLCTAVLPHSRSSPRVRACVARRNGAWRGCVGGAKEDKKFCSRKADNRTIEPLTDGFLKCVHEFDGASATVHCSTNCSRFKPNPTELLRGRKGKQCGVSLFENLTSKKQKKCPKTEGRSSGSNKYKQDSAGHRAWRVRAVGPVITQHTLLARLQQRQSVARLQRCTGFQGGCQANARATAHHAAYPPRLDPAAARWRSATST